ncbi:MAG: metal-dependent transcriptional regulator [Armatimonadota bacterium]|nr:metal-dependent transcriptional regulator [Armatimonadota bacterium]
MPSQNVEEYIEALFRLGATEKAVSTGDLAEKLGVAAPSVTTMLKRLVRDGLVTHEPYRGIALTDKGRALSFSLLRRHRLSERLLTDMIGLSWDKVHDVACKLEHVIAGELEDDVYAALGRPDTCPHGHPMNVAEVAPDATLFDLPSDEPAIVTMVAEESADFLQYLSQIGIAPGTEVRVVERAPFGDVITIDCGGSSHTIGKDVAVKIWVRPKEDGE